MRRRWCVRLMACNVVHLALIDVVPRYYQHLSRARCTRHWHVDDAAQRLHWKWTSASLSQETLTPERAVATTAATLKACDDVPTIASRRLLKTRRTGVAITPLVSRCRRDGVLGGANPLARFRKAGAQRTQQPFARHDDTSNVFLKTC